jgi:hypothetical protein
MSRRRGNDERKAVAHGERKHAQRPLRPKLVFVAGKWEWTGPADNVPDRSGK